MACGNNNVSRDYLSSQPTSSSHQGERLFNETQKAEGRVAVKNEKGQVITPWQKYSGLEQSGDINRFLDENRNATLNTDLHIHERFEKGGKVHLHITDRRGGAAAKHTQEMTLPHSASGNDVNKAEIKLAAILRDMKADQK